LGGSPLIEERKHALLLAVIETAIDQSNFILERIDWRWPGRRVTEFTSEYCSLVYIYHQR
jgi:hypothetical protein